MDNESPETPKPTAPRSRWKRWAVAIGVTLSMIFVGALLTVYLRYIDWPASPGELPTEIRHAAGDRPELVGTAHVYAFWSNFIDSQYLWRIEIDPDLIPLLKRELRVGELSSVSEVPGAFWSQPPYWWTPDKNAKARYFKSSGFVAESRGQDGNYYLLMYDEAQGVVFIWAKHNF
jgi:hypothetical protein